MIRMASPNVKPDYTNSIVNLTSTLAAKTGVNSIYKSLAEPRLEQMDEMSSILFIVIDGLGYNYLVRHGSGFWLRDHLVSSLNSVFPPSTGSAMTTFYTATPPVRHGVTGWFVFLREFGIVSRFLPFTTLVNEEPIQADIASFVGAEPWLKKTRERSVFLGPEWIIDSPYSRFATSGCTRIGYQTSKQLFGTARDLVCHAQESQFIFAYWPKLDAIGHDEGIESPDAIEHLLSLDRNCAKLAEEAPNNLRIVITADHGLVDIKQENKVMMGDHPELEEMLITPVCGDTRACYFYVRPSEKDAFQSYMSNQLGYACEIHKPPELIEKGWFGPEEPSRMFSSRVGDYIGIMKDGYALLNEFPKDEHTQLIGHHGGLSEEEMLVPLIVY